MTLGYQPRSKAALLGHSIHIFHILFHKTHLPGYVDDYDVLKSKGVELIVCVSVNDAFVMDAWGKSQGATGKIRMLADTSGEFTKV